LPLKEKYLADELEKFREQAANKARRDRLDEEKGLQLSYLREEILGFGARDCSAVGRLLFGRQPACEAEPYIVAPQQSDYHYFPDAARFW
jgi:Uri superfamily endonuclease